MQWLSQQDQEVFGRAIYESLNRSDINIIHFLKKLIVSCPVQTEIFA